MDEDSQMDSLNTKSSGGETKDASIKTPVKQMGKLFIDATVCLQDIACPTDLNLLNDARESINKTYDPSAHLMKPRKYRKKAREDYLRIEQKKVESRNKIRQAIKKQREYLFRDIRVIHNQLDQYTELPFCKKKYMYFLVVQTLYEQHSHMHKNRVHCVENRIVSIHQPHVRSIVRAKVYVFVEFRAKVKVSLMKGFVFLDEFSWDALNEGRYLLSSVEKYKMRFGFYPGEVIADKIYCTCVNLAALKNLGIKHRAKPPGRPWAVDLEHKRPGEINPIEGTFGTAKSTYGLNRVKARLNNTSEFWIATIILGYMLVNKAWMCPLSIYR